MNQQTQDFGVSKAAQGGLRSRPGCLTGELIRAGRALIRLDQSELAALSGLSLETVKRLERFRGPIDATTRTERALASAFRSRGVIFELEAESSVGLRLVA